MTEGCGDCFLYVYDNSITLYYCKDGGPKLMCSHFTRTSGRFGIAHSLRCLEALL